MFNGYDNEDDYLRSLKQNDTYSFSYSYEYIVNRYGEGNDDVELANATIDITVSWDGSSAPGYVCSYIVSAPTSIPNEWTGSAEEIFEEVRDSRLIHDLYGYGISCETFKDW